MWKIIFVGCRPGVGGQRGEGGIGNAIAAQREAHFFFFKHMPEDVGW